MCVRKKESLERRERYGDYDCIGKELPAFASVVVGHKNGQVWRSIAIETIIFLPKAKHLRTLDLVKLLSLRWRRR